jgi:hypothetical protein
MNSRWKGWTAVLLIATLGALLRLPLLWSNFWFDEIWSWEIAAQLEDPADVFTASSARIDNNHPLITLWMMLMGKNAPWPMYRLPSLLCGVASVFTAWAFLKRRGDAFGIVAAALVAFSYPLAFYSTEARGYSPVVFFSLLYLLSVDRLATTSRPAWMMAGVSSALLGLLSHPTFVYALVGALAWTIVVTRNGSSTDGRRLAWLTHGISAVFLAAYYFGFIRGLTIGGGPQEAPLVAVARAVSLVAGGDGEHLQPLWVGLSIVLLVLSLARARFGTGAMLLWGGILAPAAVIFVQLVIQRQAPPLAPRYFLVPLTLLLLALATALARDWHSPHLRRWTGALTIALCLAGMARTMACFKSARGDYLQALQRIEETGQVVLASDSTFRTSKLLAFYQRLLPEKQLILMDGTDLPGPPQYVIFNRDSAASPEPSFVIHGVRFRILTVARHAGLSGWDWIIYRREDRTSTVN